MIMRKTFNVLCSWWGHNNRHSFFYLDQGNSVKIRRSMASILSKKKIKQRKAKKKKKNSNFVSTVYCGYEKNLHYLTSF
jgi:hypothetical protein